MCGTFTKQYRSPKTSFMQNMQEIKTTRENAVTFLWKVW